MGIEYEPDKTPQRNIDDTTQRVAGALGLQLMLIVCDPQGAQVGDEGGVTFHVFCASVPRVGDMIQLQDGKRCKVKDVTFRVIPFCEDALELFPTAYAVLLNGDT